VLFKQTMPVSAYLIAIAAGKLESRPLDGSPISSVWAGKELLEAWEFAQLSDWLQAAKKLCGPYRWGRYDILILLPSFPFGEMENLGLTFWTLSLLAGDCSMVNVIAHEIAHNWTEYLVTNRTWKHFWLNLPGTEEY
jgi:aminopeptidase N